MSLQYQPDTKSAEIGFQDAKRFLRENDEGKMSELIQKTDLMQLEVQEINLEKTCQGPEYTISLSPGDNVAEEMVERDYVEPYVSGSVDFETYKQFEGEEYDTRC